jgi:signal transduction histidine kinase
VSIDRARADRAKGGLGLAIAYAVAALHGGELSISSPPAGPYFGAAAAGAPNAIADR